MKISTKILLSLMIVLMIAMIVPYGITFETVESTTVDFVSQESEVEIASNANGIENIEPAKQINAETEENIPKTDEENQVEVENVEIPDIEEPKVTKAYTPSPTQKLTSSTPYYIKVNNRQNVVTIYTKDTDGNYTVPYKAMICSIGIATPAAGKSYKVTTYKNRWNGLFGNVYGQYATQIIGDILFHSVPYTAKSPDSLEYWEYDKLGTYASLGCVRLTVEDSKWIYDNISAGTIVEFYEDDDPGPLGKPTAAIISDNERCRGWDPTDPDERNPWNLPEPIPEPISEEGPFSVPTDEEIFIEDTSNNENEILPDSSYEDISIENENVI